MDVKVFSLTSCPYCTKAKNLLELKGLGYNEYVIGVDITREEFKEQYPDARTAPYILIDNNVIGGYDSLEKYFQAQA